ncbi:MAG: hemolysin family protein, partial [Cyanobacteriota bacterium]|nr:hemolysin family protein [Cyanobacteriota bacterium]
MSALTFEIVLIILLIVANGVFSGSEVAVIASRKVRLEQMAKRGDRRAKLALKLARSPNKFLSTVQIGITLIGILNGALGGATLAQRLEIFFASIPVLAPYNEVLSLGIVVTAIAYLSLVLGELVPKRLAMLFPEAIARNVASPMRGLSLAAAPLVHLLSASTDGLLKLFGTRTVSENVMTKDEIQVLLEQGTEAGMFEEAEQEIFRRAFRFGDRPVKALMTPRTEIIWLDLEDPLADNLSIVRGSPHSRFPVGRGSLDNLAGIARVRNLLSASLAGEIDLEALVQPPLYVTENTRALKVLELFKQSGTHLALITDEYGGIEGLVTLNDLFEGLVGELPSVEELDEPMVVQREDGSWLLDGLFPIDE